MSSTEAIDYAVAFLIFASGLGFLGLAAALSVGLLRGVSRGRR